MGLLDFFKPKGEKKLEISNQQINREAHAIHDSYSKKMDKIKLDSKKLDTEIKQAHKTSEKLQELLTTAEITFKSIKGELR